MNREQILKSEFLDELRERADRHFKGKLHEAFIDWFIEAEFGSLEWKFTDNVNDGGIDAVVWRPGDEPSVILIQSKFHERIGKGSVSAKTYEELNEVVTAFRYGEDTLDEWLSRVRADLKPLYRKAHEAVQQAGSWFHQKKAFRLITTSNLGSGKLETKGLPGEAFFYAEQVLRLYEQFRQGETPKARDLRLTIDDKLPYKDRTKGTSSYLINAPVSDFRKYLEDNDVARLVARNIRYDLGSKIGGRVRKTYESAPQDFWYFHNGITIVCEDFIEANNKATLVAPSVINGAQTLYAISASGKKSSPAVVTTKVIVRPNSRDDRDSGWLLEVIRSVNSQNPVQEADLRSNEPEQLLLQSKFREQKVYYERKRGEWKVVRNEPRYRSFARISMRVLGQALAVCEDAEGKGVRLLKAGSTDRVFAKDNYRRIFPSRHKLNRAFERLYFVYRLMELLYYQGYANKESARKQGHAFWNCLWLCYQGLAPTMPWRTMTASALKERFDEFESRNTGAAKQARRAIRRVTREAWRAYRHLSKRDPERWTPNNFFKQKPGIEGLKRQVSPKVRGILRKFGQSFSI
jgi:hypothetical protein